MKTSIIALGFLTLCVACDDTAPTSGDSGVDSSTGVCQADFPCFGRTGRCAGDRQIRTMREVGCHEVCGPGPCDGRACVDGPIRECEVDEACVEVEGERGLKNATCVPCVEDDAGSGGAGGSGSPRCGTGAGCGDGLANARYPEECDDGNRFSGDGCSADCTSEDGWDCYAKGMSCVRAMGGDADCSEDACQDGVGCALAESGVSCVCPGDRSLDACPELPIRSLALPGDLNRFYATALSRDGFTVAGYGTLQVAGENNPLHAVRWSAELGTLEFERTPARSVAISADGEVVLVSRQLDALNESWLWTADASTRFRLPRDGTANDVSADGTVIVGELALAERSGRHAFRWTARDGAVDLGEMERAECARLECQHGSQAYAVSDDGRVVVGATNGGAFRWTTAEGMRELPMPSGLPRHVSVRGGLSLEAIDTSGDGAVTVGNVRASDELFPVRWTEAGGETLGALAQLGRELGRVYAVSADGSVCVGGSQTPNEAWIWTQATGLRSLADVLEEAGVDTTGWRFYRATGVSGDGKRVAGDGSYRLRPLAFLVRLP